MRSHPSPAFCLPRAAARALVLPALLATLPASAAQVPQLGTRDNRLEGTTEDIAGPADAAVNADQKRVWIAQGRVRTAFRISDRERQFNEDTSFSSSVSDQTYESIIALEHAPNQRLYTLTTDALYREDVSNPSAPTSLEYYDFSENTGKLIWQIFSHPWDSPLDLKVWPIEDSADVAVLVLTTKRIVTLIDHGPGNGITFAGYTPDLYNPFILIDPGGKFLPRDHCGVGEVPLNVVTLRNLRVHQDQNGQVMAYVTADMAGYNNLGAGRPFPKLVIACYLDSQNGFVSPTFDLDPAPSRIHYRYFNPVPTAPPSPPAGELNADRTINSLDAFSLGNERYVFLACGKKNQVKRLKVTNAYPATNCSNWAPDATFDIHLDHHVRNVLADRDVVTRFFALTQEGAHILDTLGVDPHVATQLEPFGVGCRRDMLQIAMPSPTTKTLWTAVDGIADHIAKVVDVTSHPLTVPLIDEYYAMLVSDGAVMLGTEVYLPTWGGMVRFALVSTSPPRWQAVPDSFQPAEETTNMGIVHQTEHIDTGNVGGTDYLFAPTGNGDLLVFEIDAGSKAPKPPNRILVDPGVTGWPASWTPYPADNYYSNDAAYFSLGGQSFVLVDLTNYAVPGSQPTTQTALLAYWYDPTVPEWRHVATVAAPQHSRQYTDPKLSSTVTIAPGLNNKWFAFVANELGFFSVDLTGLNNFPPTMAFKEEVCTNFQGGICEEGAEVNGLTVSMDRIFAYVHTSPNLVIRIYSWDRDSGMSITQTAELSQSQFLPPGAPTAGRCFRARFHTTNNPSTGAGFVYFANEPYLLQMKWPGATGADSLDFTGWWRSDYEAHLQDCRFYDVPNVGPSILVSKDGESFAVIMETP